uniref:Uncharacterized protein n=1 Tax=viral metagenome TaxID=1070528 RepID=A0A6M3KDA0_9ZZZZ
MKTLVEYLAEYLDQEGVMTRPNYGKMDALNRFEMFEIVKNGIDAYESTENCTITVIGGDCPDCGAAMEKGISTLFTHRCDEIEVVSYQCPECGYIVHG